MLGKILKEKVVSVSEMNSQLKWLDDCHYKIVERAYSDGDNLSFTAYLYITNSIMKLTYKAAKTITYICYLDPYMRVKYTNGAAAWRVEQRFYKVPVLHSKEDAPMVSIQILWNNQKLKGVWNDAIEYDVNSMFSWGLLQPMPNTNVAARIDTKLKPNEIGFIEPDIVTYKVGDHVDYAFPLMESPFKRFVDYYYGIKSNHSNDKIKRQIAKDTMNYFIGYCQRKNSFIRTTVIDNCNKRMWNLIHKYKDKIIYVNTDSIVATSNIDELDAAIGDGVGEWKIDKKGRFAFNGFNYQWEGQAPSVRGKKGHYAPADYDILKDGTSFDDSSEYHYDKIKNRVIKKV